MARRPDVGAAAVAATVKRIAWLISPAGHLVVAHEARQDRQAGGVGRGPGVRPQRVASSGRRSRPSPRASRRRRCGIGVRRARRACSVRVSTHQDVAVAVAVGAALDRRVRAGSGTGPGRSRRRSRRSPAPRLVARHDDVGDADRPAVPRAGAEVRVQARVGADRRRRRPRSSAPPAARRRARSRCCRRERSSTLPMAGPAAPAGTAIAISAAPSPRTSAILVRPSNRAMSPPDPDADRRLRISAVESRSRREQGLCHGILGSADPFGVISDTSAPRARRVQTGRRRDSAPRLRPASQQGAPAGRRRGASKGRVTPETAPRDWRPLQPRNGRPRATAVEYHRLAWPLSLTRGRGRSKDGARRLPPRLMAWASAGS